MKRIVTLSSLGFALCALCAFRYTQATASDKIPESALAQERVLDPGPSMSSDHEHHLSVHWATLPSLAALHDASDLVAHGRVVAQRTIPGVIDKEPPLTVSTVEVARVLAQKPGALDREGDSVAPSRTIDVVELGGLLSDGCTVAPDDKPLLRVGDEAVLFLSAHRAAGEPAAAAAAQYHVVGGYQGRIDVVDGRLQPLAVRVGKPGPLAALGAADVAAFATRLAALATPPAR